MEEWNSTKFLIYKEGKEVKQYASPTSPLKMEEEIKKCFHQEVRILFLLRVSLTLHSGADNLTIIFKRKQEAGP
ncbi:hypothetical protein [Planococcus massiliensis]|uniref:hypothetical protein n=1 Tax=Planococcus massiliensis TaxID=1499687 RepID=UPI0018FEAF68|nr:hypothetical protein [Planococcus massiliensis]